MFRKMSALFLNILMLVGILSCAGADNAVIWKFFDHATGITPPVSYSSSGEYEEHPYYFANMSRLRFTNQNAMKMYGYNNKGQTVNYIMHFEIPYQDWMTEPPKVEELSWEEKWYTSVVFDFWNDAMKGKTSAVVDIVYGKYGSAYTIDIYLPDNPSLAPKQYFVLSGMGDLIKVEFELSYKGNYQTGNGWNAYNVKRYYREY